MSPRRACVFLALVVAMLAVAMAPRVGPSVVDHREEGVTADTGTIIQRVDGTLPRPAADNASDRVERTLRSGLVLLAVLAALLWAASGGRREVAGTRAARRAAGSRRWPIAGRAPPSFRIA